MTKRTVGRTLCSNLMIHLLSITKSNCEASDNGNNYNTNPGVLDIPHWIEIYDEIKSLFFYQ